MVKLSGRHNLINAYILLGLLSCISFVIACIVSDGGMFVMATSDHTGTGIFGDNFIHVVGSSYLNQMYELYGDACCFPPFAYLLYYLIYCIDPVYCVDIWDWFTMRDSNSTMLLFVSYIVIEFLLLAWILQRLYRQYGFKIGVLMTSLIVVSYPFMFAATRHGNCVGITAIICLIAVVLGESDSKLEQEIALILIAVAAGMKFYPAILGLIYLKRKDWKKVARLIVYGIVIVIGPFVFFGGIDGIRHLAGHLTALSDREAGINTFEGLFTWMFSKIGVLAPHAQTLSVIGTNVLFVVLIICFFLTKKKWQGMLFIGAIMTSYISSSFDYNCVYYLPAFIMFLQEEYIGAEQNKFTNIWIAYNMLVFAMLFTVPFYLSFVFYNLATGLFLIIHATVFFNLVNSLYEFIYFKVIKKQ